MEKIYKFRDENFDLLDQFMPIVKRVHGQNHPEFFEVADIYDDIKAKIDKKDLNLDKEFKQLKETTDDYKIPQDVCETYEKIYKDLESLNKLYQEK
ncbi:MAG: iron-sulfur cluster repair di-iron protein, ric [Anaerococcus sp.]|nr:iron-sulfur cluster repair di-iron protein, ric [Anaerococcus sp.]